MKIPFCRSEILQDFTIDFGRLAKGNSFAGNQFTAEVDVCQHNGEDLERFCVWIYSYYNTRTALTLWDDKTVLISMALLPTEHHKQFTLEFYPECDAFTPAMMVAALRDTVSLSTRFCYNEAPIETLRKIWHHKGDFKIEGTLSREQRRNSTPFI